jgi:formylglycine-generating enzyme required for sulfatase activity
MYSAASSLAFGFAEGSRTRAAYLLQPGSRAARRLRWLPSRPVIDRALVQLDPVARARFFDDLASRDADTRPGIGLHAGRPDLLWRGVPPGRVRLGGDPLALYPWAGRRVDLPHPWWMAAYPVTVDQYQAFIDADGYTDRWRHCWTAIGWGWKQRYNQGAGLDEPLEWSRRAQTRRGTHPVEVGWYEAVAFAAWLESLRRAGVLPVPADAPPAHVIRLPDEAEREWAARYPDGRLFPWGDAYQPGAANIDETAYGQVVGPTRLGRLTAVGIYPLGRQSALDIYDLSGNASEWCQTAWKEAGYSGDNDLRAVGYRVVRGGHLHNGIQFARSASRSWGDPDPDDQYDPSNGFRVVLGPPLGPPRGD